MLPNAPCMSMLDPGPAITFATSCMIVSTADTMVAVVVATATIFSRAAADSGVSDSFATVSSI